MQARGQTQSVTLPVTARKTWTGARTQSRGAARESRGVTQGAEPVGGCSSQVSFHFLLSSPPSPPAVPRVEEGSQRGLLMQGGAAGLLDVAGFAFRGFGDGLVALWILKCMLGT